MKTLLTVFISGLLLAGCDQKSDDKPAATTPPTAAAQNKLPDNTGTNVRDRDPNAVTPSIAGQGKSDVEMAADIRRRIMAGNMSINAQNVKVVLASGKVTLRGPVNTQDEKDKIAKLASDVVGFDNVDNQLEVKPG
jgi:hyperosmotically inducible periplasmic protein